MLAQPENNIQKQAKNRNQIEMKPKEVEAQTSSPVHIFFCVWHFDCLTRVYFHTDTNGTWKQMGLWVFVCVFGVFLKIKNIFFILSCVAKDLFETLYHFSRAQIFDVFSLISQRIQEFCCYFAIFEKLPAWQTASLMDSNWICVYAVGFCLSAYTSRICLSETFI